jgi:hypothetical protein
MEKKYQNTFITDTSRHNVAYLGHQFIEHFLISPHSVQNNYYNYSVILINVTQVNKLAQAATFLAFIQELLI